MLLEREAFFDRLAGPAGRWCWSALEVPTRARAVAKMGNLTDVHPAPR